MLYIVTGRHRVSGKAKGEVVELPERQGDRLIAAGHVEPAPPQPPQNKPKSPPKKDKPAGGGEGVSNDA